MQDIRHAFRYSSEVCCVDYIDGVLNTKITSAICITCYIQRFLGMTVFQSRLRKSMFRPDYSGVLNCGKAADRRHIQVFLPAVDQNLLLHFEEQSSSVLRFPGGSVMTSEMHLLISARMIPRFADTSNAYTLQRTHYWFNLLDVQECQKYGLRGSCGCPR